jgi:hypothetical protein
MVMLRTACLGLALLALACSVWADGDVSTISTDPEVSLSPLILPSIRAINIKENGATSPAAENVEPQCKRFRLAQSNVIDYLRTAQVVTEHDFLHTLDWSPCFASGTVYFEGGMTGVWGIQQYRAGSLKLSDGRDLYLYCPKCKSRRFSNL